MSYRIAGIDVLSGVRRRNRKRVPVRAADVWQQSRTTAIAGCMAARARGRGSSHGIDGPILETSVGNAGKVLEADTREARRGKAEERYIWRRRSPIAHDGDARRISPPNAW
jgi:hypothetical protein